MNKILCINFIFFSKTLVHLFESLVYASFIKETKFTKNIKIMENCMNNNHQNYYI